MSTETLHYCDRCRRLLDDSDPWLQLTVHPSENHLLRADENRIDLCDGCEDDMVRFMAGEMLNKFVENAG